MNTPTTTTAGSSTTITAGSYRLQQLARQAGVGMDTLALALGGGEFAIEAKPTARIVLQPMEAQMLQVLTANLDKVKATSAMQTSALHDAADAAAYRANALEERLCAAECAKEHAQWELDRCEQRMHALQNRSFWQRLRG